MTRQVIEIEAIVKKPIQTVWTVFTLPEHIICWNQASEDWHTPKAENDLRVGGQFCYQMAAKDGSFSFDFGGTYDEVVPLQKISYTIGDGRRVQVTFTETAEGVLVNEQFEAEMVNDAEMQRAGWQAILNNFKKHTENQ